MAARTVDGPEKDWLDDDEVAILLGVSVKTLERLIAEDGFPEGHVIRGQTVKWTWDDVVFWRWFVEKRGRMKVAEKKTIVNHRQPSSTDAK